MTDSWGKNPNKNLPPSHSMGPDGPTIKGPEYLIIRVSWLLGFTIRTMFERGKSNYWSLFCDIFSVFFMIKIFVSENFKKELIWSENIFVLKLFSISIKRRLIVCWFQIWKKFFLQNLCRKKSFSRKLRFYWWAWQFQKSVFLSFFPDVFSDSKWA